MNEQNAILCWMWITADNSSFYGWNWIWIGSFGLLFGFSWPWGSFSLSFCFCKEFFIPFGFLKDLLRSGFVYFLLVVSNLLGLAPVYFSLSFNRAERSIPWARYIEYENSLLT